MAAENILPAINKSIRSINRNAALLGAGLFAVSALFGENPVGSLSSLSSIGLFGASQIVGFAGMVIGLNALTQKSVRAQLMQFSAYPALSAVQFGLLAMAGIHAALGGIVSMSMATVRGLYFASKTNPVTGEPTMTHAQRGVRALGFAAATVAFVFSGFGVMDPLINMGQLLSGDPASIGMALPIAASVCGSLGDAMPRLRYMRPIKMTGAAINCIYNAFFSGGINHLISESGTLLVQSHQIIRDDMPPANFEGKKLTRRERVSRYLDLMMQPDLPEKNYVARQKLYERAQEESLQKALGERRTQEETHQRARPISPVSRRAAIPASQPRTANDARERILLSRKNGRELQP